MLGVAVYYFTDTFFISNQIGPVISLVFIAGGILFSPWLAALFGANNETLQPSITYIMIVMIFTPCFIYSNIYVAFIRNDNSPRRSAPFSTPDITTGSRRSPSQGSDCAISASSCAASI